MTDIQAFVEGMKATSSELIILGSATNGTWKPGSDIDMILFSDSRVSREFKSNLYAAYWKLNDVYGLHLEEAPLIHPIIFFADSPVKRAVARILLEGKIPDWHLARKVVKKLVPRQRIFCR